MGITRCHICGEPTNMACSDCRIDLGASVYVCGKSSCRDAHDGKCGFQLRQRYATLVPEFLEAMNDILLYGQSKYGAQSFHEMRRAGQLNREALARRSAPTLCADYAREHFSQYLSHTPHDHFNTDIHQLAAVAVNAMMEAALAGLTK